MSATLPAAGILLPDAETPDIVVTAPAATMRTAEDDMQYEPSVEKWSRKARLAFIAVATAGLWFAASRFWG